MGTPLTTKGLQSLTQLAGVTYMVYQSSDAALIYLELAKYVNNRWRYLGYVQQDDDHRVDTNIGPGLVAYKDLLHLVYQQGEGSTSIYWATYNHEPGKWTLNGPILIDGKTTLECSSSPSVELGIGANGKPAIIMTYRGIDEAGSICWATYDGQNWTDHGVITVN